ncbi:MAG: ATP synthase F1 subunit epsilon [Alphaproteobacteria bacterium]|nr:ATP synthase F1 subunit epsilon [Alphaproteobacteria bacterium]
MATEASRTINFELVSPEEKLISGPVRMAVIPGEEGEMGVGAGHASFVVSLRPGVVKLYDNDNETPRKIFIAGGFADITGENCTVLAEEAVDVATLRQSDIEHAIKDLKEDLNMVQEPADKARVSRQLALAKARLSAVTGQIVL